MAPETAHRRRKHEVAIHSHHHTTGDVIHNTHDEGSSTPDLHSTRKRSGTHNLSRTGYHEEKCRNVLVRYCAHIPRNYQYKDGIQQIFLILREHLGDENLDLAGGVLYELIEVDCEHTDDPGAAFQRWKCDHLRRYADLELPHVPHMTTITTSFIPTQKLAQWRSTHSSRYPFVLSDSSTSAERASVDPSCIRNRKAWLIDHTLYVSSRSDGTRPLNRPNPKEFHEMQWNHEYGTQGRFVEERDVPIISPGRPSKTSPQKTTDSLLNTSNRCKGLRRYSPGIGLLQKLAGRVSMHHKTPEVEQKRRSWMHGSLMFDTSLLRDKRADPEIDVTSLLGGFQVPNSIFARKHLLIEASDSLPTSIFLTQMPTAESKATDTIVEAATKGLLDKAQAWSFRGPFTPQLGFDGGLDYQWGLQEPTIASKRCDVIASTKEAPDLRHHDRFEGSKSKRTNIHETHQRISAKRQGMIFSPGIGGKGDRDTIRSPSSNYTTSSRSVFDGSSATVPRGLNEKECLQSPPSGQSSALSTKPYSTLSISDRIESIATERSILRTQGKLEFGSTFELPGWGMPFRVGLPSPLAVATIERMALERRSIFPGVGASPRVTYCAADSIGLGDEKAILKKHTSVKDTLPSRPSPLSPTPPSSSSSGFLNERDQAKVWGWLGSATRSNQDPNFLNPFTDWTSQSTDSSSTAGQSPQNSALPEGMNVPTPKQDLSPAPRQLLRDWPLSQATPSRLPTTQSRVKHVHFTNSTKMDSTPKRGRSAGDPEMVRARAPSRGEPFHSRAASYSQQDRTGSRVPYYNHSRDNSVASSRTYQQLGKVPSPERGRSLQRRYEFPSSDSDNALSPVFEGDMDNRESHITTMTDIMNGSRGESPQRPRSMSRHKSPPKPAGYSSTQQKEKRRPTPLDLRDVRKYVVNSNIQPIHNPISPTESEMAEVFEDGDSSVYADGTAFPSYDEAPLRAPEESGVSGVNILRGYNDWRESQSGGGPVARNGYLYAKSMKEQDSVPEIPNESDQVPQRQQAKEAVSRPSTTNESPKKPEEPEAPPFTPLTPYLMNTRVASKTLIGDKGWLEDTAAQGKKPESKKSTSFMGNFKKTARKIAEITEFRAGQPRAHTARELNISLDPREQSLLYCELEFILSNTLSGYINIQLHSGRLNAHVHAKISDAWEQKGRPKVTGFRYDLETQIDMIAAHVGTFRFYGPHQTDSDLIKGLLYGMKMNARVMRVRTYCQPDPVIAKHILDAQVLTQLLDSPESAQIPLAEVAQFFKVIIEREQDVRTKREAEQSFVEYAPNAGLIPRSPEALSPPKGKYPGEYRVKNQINVPVNERTVSGTVLEPKAYDPSQSRLQANEGRQPWHGA
ncbi:hypothetical protein F5Y13DRAFT_200078 [Hypoxylon sp. FL1857]|nr:hypothetical protein F5Y13DRAFT_200078 [Hypoxylon sp. FL1857]